MSFANNGNGTEIVISTPLRTAIGTFGGALKESLDAYRNVVESASETQERNMQLAQNFFENIVETLRGQLESSRSLLLEPVAKQQEVFQNLTQEWMDAYVRLLNAPLEFYKASTGGVGGEGSGR